MGRYLKTENCIICGNKATLCHGHVVAKERKALGNYVDKNIIAGFCDSHSHIESPDSNYGEYDNGLMGKCIDLFNEENKTLNLVVS